MFSQSIPDNLNGHTEAKPEKRQYAKRDVPNPELIIVKLSLGRSAF